MKKIASIILAAIMVIAMAVPTMAAAAESPTPTNTPKDSGNFTITIGNNVEDYAYTAYQIFKGDLYDGTLSNIEWGDGVDQSKNVEGKILFDAIQAINVDGATPFSACKTAKDVAEVLGSAANNAKDSAVAQAFADAVSAYLTGGTGSTYEAGKYTITGLKAGYYLVKNESVPDDGAYTRFILEVVDDVEATPKSSVPSVDKQVQDEDTDAESAQKGEGWGETADHELNESFKFKLIATLPEDVDFASYETYKLEFHDTMSAGVTFESIESVTITVGGVSKDVPVYSADNLNGYLLDGVAANEAGKTWTLTINDIKQYFPDITGGVTVTVIYNAHLNENAQINAPSNEPAGTENQNEVFLKYSNNPNAGAEGDMGTTLKDIVFVFTYEIPGTKVDGGAEKKPLEGAGFKLKNSATNKYATFKDGKLTGWVENIKEATEVFSGADGKITMQGLDVGDYVIEETTTPPGYNTMDPLDVSVKTTEDGLHAESSEGTDATVKYQVNNGDNVEIINNKGSVLPETGGIGTTIFYVIGAILVLGAGVVLITRKRVNK